MHFLDRSAELARLDRLARRQVGGLVVLYGRRRIGKTRILLEWARRHGGLYTVADQSASDIQLRYTAEAIATRFPGFADVEYRDWSGLLARLAREAKAASWHGPIIFDELPYLVLSCPELPSVLQRWMDHEAAAARLLVGVAGSSQRMMQGLVLPGNAPLYGRAAEVLEVPPLDPRYLGEALDLRRPIDVVQAYAAWGGIPRYWELAAAARGSLAARVDQLVLDPRGPLHREPDRLLVEELPTAMEVRPVLDAIGAGAHRVSEIAARVGRPATSMSRPLDRLLELGLVRREIPFGESERNSRRSLYRIGDPFFRLWFRVVAPHRALLTGSSPQGRFALLRRHWPHLAAAAWEELCRAHLALLGGRSDLGRRGPWSPGTRWWRGDESEWDVISRGVDHEHLLLGEVKWTVTPLSGKRVHAEIQRLVSRPLPPVIDPREARRLVRVLFVPELAEDAPREAQGVRVVDGDELLGLSLASRD